MSGRMPVTGLFPRVASQSPSTGTSAPPVETPEPGEGLQVSEGSELRIEIDKNGNGTLILNGQDMSPFIKRLYVSLTAGMKPYISAELFGCDINFETTVVKGTMRWKS